MRYQQVSASERRFRPWMKMVIACVTCFVSPEVDDALHALPKLTGAFS